MAWRYGIILWALACGSLFASDHEARFREHFEKGYSAGQCGRNILAFAAVTKKEAGNLDGFYVVTIKNRGFSVFGMVNAEAARGFHKGKPEIAERNWFHHVIMLDDSGRVYDFDYTTEATVLRIEDYIEKMFLDEPECTSKVPGKFCGGRTNKLGDYQFDCVPARDFVKGVTEGTKAYMGEVLQDWRVLIQ